MNPNIKVKEIMSYGGHNIKANGNVNLGLNASYSELVNSVKLLQMLNNDVIVKVKKPDTKVFKIGMFRVQKVQFDSDGESRITLNSITDYVEIGKLNDLVKGSDEIKEFVVLFAAEIEEENEDA
jgi:hypothetical protein